MNKISNYWDGTGRFQNLANELAKLIPAAGPVANARKNAKLERFRKVANAYYDLFNNGGGNRPQSIVNFFGRVKQYARRSSWDHVYARTEPVLDNAILDAALEQGLISLAEAYVLRVAA